MMRFATTWTPISRFAFLLIFAVASPQLLSRPLEARGRSVFVRRQTPPTEKILISGSTTTGTLATEQSSRFGLSLDDAQYFKVILAKSGTGISATLSFDQIGITQSIPCWHYGPIEISEIAEKHGRYSLELHLCDENSSPSFALTLLTTKVADPSDRLRVAANKADMEGDGLVAEYRPAPRQTALRKYSESLRIWRLLGDRDRERNTLVKMGTLHADIGDSERALNVFETARTVPSSPLGRGHRGQVYLSLARVFQWRGETDKAISYCNNALQVSREHLDEAGEAEALFQLGYMYYDKGEIEKAIKVHREA